MMGKTIMIRIKKNRHTFSSSLDILIIRLFSIMCIFNLTKSVVVHIAIMMSGSNLQNVKSMTFPVRHSFDFMTKVVFPLNSTQVF